jgi:hypothetical protein
VAAELAESFFPDLGIVGGSLQICGVQCEAADFRAGIVARLARRGQKRAMGVGLGRSSGREASDQGRSCVNERSGGERQVFDPR